MSCPVDRGASVEYTEDLCPLCKGGAHQEPVREQEGDRRMIEGGSVGQRGGGTRAIEGELVRQHGGSRRMIEGGSVRQLEGGKRMIGGPSVERRGRHGGREARRR